VTFTETLARFQVPFRRGNGVEIALNCPFCGDHEFRFHVNVRTGAGKCWHGSCEFRSKRADLAFLKQRRIVAGDLSGVEEAAPPLPAVHLPRDFHRLTCIDDEFDRKALAYLLKRGITRAQIARWKIGVSFEGRYAYRVLFPVYADGDLKAFVGRDYTGRQKPKYLNSKGDKFLYGVDRDAETVVLVEGVFKKLRMDSAGWNASAVLGRDITDLQLAQINECACENVVVYPDPDPVGRDGARKIAGKLAEQTKKNVWVAWPIVRPADEASLTELREMPVVPYDDRVDLELQSVRHMTSENEYREIFRSL